MIDTTAPNLREFDIDKQEDHLDEEENQFDISSLIGEETKVEQLLPQPAPIQLKKVTKLIGQKRTYNMYSESNNMIISKLNRPYVTLDQVSEKLKERRREKNFLQEKDVPIYDPELFEKQMDLEIMNIMVNEASYRLKGAIVP